MSGWLLDTPIIDRLGRRPKDPILEDWIASYEDYFMSAISFVEIAISVKKLGAHDAPRASDLSRWLDRMVNFHSERILPVDARIGALAAELAHGARGDRRDLPVSYFLIAATARIHNHGLLTNDVGAFEPLMPGLPVHDPLTEAVPD